MTITYVVSVTDLIQAIGVGLGVPVAIWSIVKLFMKDKDKAKQIKALSDLAETQKEILLKQGEQISELSSQTTEFKYQTEIFRESNDLLKEQISIQTKALLNDKDYKEEFLKFEKKKRKSEIRPYFKPNGGYAGGTVINAKIINLGERAYLTEITLESSDNADVVLSNFTPQTVEKNSNVNIQLRVSNISKNLNEVAYSLVLKFKDEDENCYSQFLKGIGGLFATNSPLELD